MFPQKNTVVPVVVVYYVNLAYGSLDAHCYLPNWNCDYDMGDVNCDNARTGVRQAVPVSIPPGSRVELPLARNLTPSVVFLKYYYYSRKVMVVAVNQLGPHVLLSYFCNTTLEAERQGTCTRDTGITIHLTRSHEERLST